MKSTCTTIYAVYHIAGCQELLFTTTLWRKARSYARQWRKGGGKHVRVERITTMTQVKTERMDINTVVKHGIRYSIYIQEKSGMWLFKEIVVGPKLTSRINHFEGNGFKVKAYSHSEKDIFSNVYCTP
jgi:hypothetical protein